MTVISSTIGSRHITCMGPTGRLTGLQPACNRPATGLQPACNRPATSLQPARDRPATGPRPACNWQSSRPYSRSATVLRPFCDRFATGLSRPASNRTAVAGHLQAGRALTSVPAPRSPPPWPSTWSAAGTHGRTHDTRRGPQTGAAGTREVERDGGVEPGTIAVLLQCCCNAVAVLLQCCCSAGGVGPGRVQVADGGEIDVDPC